MENLGSDVRVNSFKFTLVSLQLSPIQLAQSCFCFFLIYYNFFFCKDAFQITTSLVLTLLNLFHSSVKDINCSFGQIKSFITGKYLKLKGSSCTGDTHDYIFIRECWPAEIITVCLLTLLTIWVRCLTRLGGKDQLMNALCFLIFLQ